jgi:N-acylglucosamine 2-epimerase
MLEKYAERYRSDLVNTIIPFWLKNSLDKEYGGYFTCLDRTGKVYDPKKYMWLEGREVWTFSRLYNELEKKQEYLDAAKLGVDFIRKYGRDSKGRVYFSLTRDGKPYFFQRKVYGAVFYMLGLLEYSKATGDKACFDESVDLFWKITKWIEDPSMLDRPAFEGNPPSSSLADVMVLASMAIELMRVKDDPRYREMIQKAMDGVKKHFEPTRKILIERVPLSGVDISDWPEGRFFNPGHSIEVAWFLLHMLEIIPNPELQKLAFDVMEGSLELGWDKKYGGLYYFMDIEGRPTLQLESNMKLWWPHTEAMYATVLAYTMTKDAKWKKWLQKIDAYAYKHFVDAEYGEWFGYCDRRGDLALECKGGNYKGFFHVPRALLMCVQRIEAANAKKQK